MSPEHTYIRFMTHTAHTVSVSVSCGSGNMSEKLKGNILVTGANRGIGLALVKQLGETPGVEGHIYACCRDPQGPGAQVRLSQKRNLEQHM